MSRPELNGDRCAVFSATFIRLREALLRFLEDGRPRVDNNHHERELPGTPLGAEADRGSSDRWRVVFERDVRVGLAAEAVELAVDAHDHRVMKRHGRRHAEPPRVRGGVVDLKRGARLRE
ncbi:MAG TPA: hypothetical protein VGF45_00720 [Polyangia bacterium]